MKQLKADKPSLALELKADEQAPLKNLVNVWDALTQAGYPVKEVPARILVKKPKNQKNWSGPYLKKLPLDPWGKLYHYSYSEKTKIPYLSSSGPDGKHKNGDDIIDEHNR